MLEELNVAVDGDVATKHEMVGKRKLFRWVQNISIQIFMFRCISYLHNTTSPPQGCMFERRVAGWGWRLVWVVWWVVSNTINIRRFEYFAGEWKTSSKTHWWKQYLTPILLLHAAIDVIKRFGGLEMLEVGVADATHAAARPSWCRCDSKQWWVTNVIDNKSIDIHSPCSFCTM